MKLLVDEMYDGMDVMLQQHGYECSSVKKLICDGKLAKHDDSIVAYARANNMVLITADRENETRCINHSAQCVCITMGRICDMVVEELEFLEDT